MTPENLIKKMSKPEGYRRGKNGLYLNLYPKSSYDPTRWERAVHTVDIAIFRVFNGKLEILLIERKKNSDFQCDAFPGKLALPGGFLDVAKKESLEDAAKRELREETGVVTSGSPRQFRTYGTWDRDPRWYTISTAYFYLMPPKEWGKVKPEAGDDAVPGSARWHTVDSLDSCQTAFDHIRIITDITEHLKAKCWKDGLMFCLSPDEFTIPQVREVCRAIGVGPYDNSNFIRALKKHFTLVKKDTPETRTKPGRPPVLYKLPPDRV